MEQPQNLYAETMAAKEVKHLSSKSSVVGACGFWVVDKPGGMTSFDVIRRLKRVSGKVRMGHTGTLDPMATGVLPVCVGAATRLLSYLRLEPKVYRGSFRFGIETDTWDVTGTVIGEGDVPILSEDDLLRVFRGFEGEQCFQAPLYSAIKHKGKPLYRYAREGKAVTAPERQTCIDAFRLLKRVGETVQFELQCSRGTYVRSVVHAVGREVGCGATLGALRRLASGQFKIEDACSIEHLQESLERMNLADTLLPMEQVLDHMRFVSLREEGMRKVLHGNSLRSEDIEPGENENHPDALETVGQKVCLAARGSVVAVAEVRSDSKGLLLQPVRVLGELRQQH